MKLTFGFCLLFALMTLVSLLLFELGKNTVLGWALLAALLAGYFIFRGKLLATQGFGLRFLGFLGAVLLTALIFKLSGPPVRAVPAVGCKDPKATGVYTVEQGQLTGVFNEDASVEVFTGIPYAKPPVGELRWKEPQPPEGWDGVRICDTFAPMSMQTRNSPVFDSLAEIFVYHSFRVSLSDNWIAPMSEDSLYLNVWKPAGDCSGLPVLVYIHGGSLTSGQAWYDQYNPEAIAKQGVVVVNFAYRLNVFGYYASEALAAESEHGTTGNYGLLDQIQALRWVQQNIAAFGGDPARVTLAGESAGASSVNALCVSPLSKGLFLRAIAESSGITAKVPYHTFRTLQDALSMGKEIQQEFGAADLNSLRAVPAEKLVRTRHINNSMTVDGWAITEQPWRTYEKGENHETALLQGYNVHEADLFCMMEQVNRENYVEKLQPLYGSLSAQAAAIVPARAQEPFYKCLIDRGGSAKGAFDEAVSAAWFSYSHYRWAKLLAKQGVPVYTYYFTKDNKGMGSHHAGELPYFYGCLQTHPENYEESDQALSKQMLQYYVNFIKTGNPNASGLPVWENVQAAPELVLQLGEQVTMIEDPHLELHRLLDRFQETEAK